MARQTYEFIDELAIRVVDLGGAVRGTIQAAADNTALEPFPMEESDDIRLLEELARRIDRVVVGLRQAIATSQADLVTRRVFLDVTSGIEEQRLTLLTHLARDTSLT
jgi:DNA-binding ferritin-like protein